MIKNVVLSRLAQKQLRKVPKHIVVNLIDWVRVVEIYGLEEVRRRPGYHDEPLKGDWRGQRSIRLSRSYRAVYEVKSQEQLKFVSVEEVSKHGY